MSITAAVTGMGGVQAANAVDRLLDRYQPQRVLLIGFAGGLAPDLRAGHVLEINWVINGQGDEIKLARWAADSPQGPPPSDWHLQTVDQLVHSVTAKHDLFKRHSCDAVDMETFHIAQRVAKCDVPLTVLRAIYDPADMALPAAMQSWIKPNGQPNTIAVLRYLLARPWRITTLRRLHRHANHAALRLADDVENLIKTPAHGPPATA